MHQTTLFLTRLEKEIAATNKQLEKLKQSD
jgi:hypothetical protein